MLLYAFAVLGSWGQCAQLKDEFTGVRFQYEELRGIGYEQGYTRRDPSDIIKVDDTYYVYYTKVKDRAPGYWGTLWYAVSTDQGYTWEEKGEVLGRGNDGTFDSQATFTPNIIYARGRYWLYYTGVKPTPGNLNDEFENNSTTDITAIGVAVSDSPGGPFKRVTDEPILTVSIEPEKFDSFRVDDAALIYRNGLFWLYYKGRSRMYGELGPRNTQMGVAFSKSPEGPFEKLNSPLLSENHEVMIWPFRRGVATLASFSSTFEYASDGIDFTFCSLGVNVENRPNAPGAYRPDLTNPVVEGGRLTWGIGMVHNGNEAYLIRYSTLYE